MKLIQNSTQVTIVINKSIGNNKILNALYKYVEIVKKSYSKHLLV